MRLIKAIVGGIALPVLWLWAWMSQPKDQNKQGLR
jgi:hypothetical protein